MLKEQGGIASEHAVDETTQGGGALFLAAAGRGVDIGSAFGVVRDPPRLLQFLEEPNAAGSDGYLLKACEPTDSIRS